MAHERNEKWRSCISHYSTLDKSPAGIGYILTPPCLLPRLLFRSSVFVDQGLDPRESIKMTLESRVSESTVDGPAIIDDLPLPGQ